MITLPSHTFNAFHPLDVVYFKPFKIAFRKEKNITMVRRNYTKPHKIALVRWVDKTLDLAPTPKKSCQGSKVQGFCHLTLITQKMTLVFYTHCRIGPWKKKNQNKRMVNKIGQNIQLQRSSST